MFLHYLTLHKTEMRLDELKQGFIDTWNCILQGIDEASGKHGCMHV